MRVRDPDDPSAWRHDLSYAEVALDLRTHGRTGLPETLPAQPEQTARTVRADGWTLTPHWQPVLDPETGTGLLAVRLSAPDGWTGAVLMEEKTSPSMPWRALRRRLPALCRPLAPGTAGEVKRTQMTRTFTIAARTLRTAMTDPDRWGTTRTLSGALAAAEWAGQGYPHLGLRNRMRLLDYSLITPCAILDTGWDLTEETLDWLLSAHEGRWLSQHAGRWGLADLRRLKDTGWTLDTVQALHATHPYIGGVRHWADILREFADLADRCGTAKATAYLSAGFTYAEAHASETQAALTTADLKAFAALRSPAGP